MMYDTRPRAVTIAARRGGDRVQVAQQYPVWKRNMGLLYDTFWNHNLK
jgi:hypothetical protein